MATGDLVKLGTFYKANAKQLLPTNPINGGNIPAFSAGQALEIRNTDPDDAYKLRWRELVIGSKRFLTADRNILHSVSHDDLNAQGLVTGKEITIDGQQYKLRLLTGGSNYRNTSDAYAGGTPTANEWDQIISGEANYPGLPKPTATDLTNNAANQSGAHNQFWNWYNMYSWAQETYTGNGAYRAFRGYGSARYWSFNTSSGRNAGIGWRPVLEVLNSAPVISGGTQNLGNKTAPFSVEYQVSDPENDAVNVVEKLNAATIKTETNVTQGVNRTITITNEQWADIPLNVESTVTVEATDSKGAKSTRVHTFTKTNAAPTAVAVEPLGNLSKIGIVDTTTPIFVWSFNDPDIGDKQSSYQFIIENTQGGVTHDSGKKISTQSFYQLPEANKLEWGTRYKWKVRVWDKFDVPSEYSFDEFVMPNRPPNAANVRPGSVDIGSPEGASLTPAFEWEFEDLDLEAQTAYQLVLKTTDADTEIYNTNKVFKNVSKHTIPDFVLAHGVAYYVQITVWDPNGLSGTSDKAYIITNATPTAPLLTTPINNYRTTLNPKFSGIVGTDQEDDGQHFIIQISESITFEGSALSYRSDVNRTGWKVNGFDIPEAGVKNDQAGQTVTYDVQVQLDMNKKYYWRMAAVDANTKAVGKYSEVRHVRAGNQLAYDTLIHPIDTGAVAANRVLVALDYALASDGSNPAVIKLWICNNANDVAPTWEEMTTEFIDMDYYAFTNADKTAGTYAVALKVQVIANDAMGDIFIASHGFTFD